MTLRIGSLFSGYGGLDLAVQAIYDAEHAWFCEFDPAPSRILAHHWPDVPNLKDVTAADWATVEPIDILTGGFPCQDVSVAGRRAGMTDGTRSGLWSHMVRAIDVLRPELVVIENVGGLFSAQADSRVEPCDYNMGDADSGGHAVLLRALDSVLGTLATLGYDAEWTALRAADVGAPHGRLRVFITAHPSGGGSGGWAALPLASGTGRADAAPVGADPRPDAPGSPARLMPTPRALDATGVRGVTENRSAEANARAGLTLTDVTRLLPTPSASLGEHRRDNGQDPERRRAGGHAVSTADVACYMPEQFGPYARAIHRWERVLGRPAPAPTEPGKTRPRLSSRFVEWLMGLDDGHVTGVGLTRAQELKALGNGVVPQQGAAALRHLHNVRSPNP